MFFGVFDFFSCCWNSSPVVGVISAHPFFFISFLINLFHLIYFDLVLLYPLMSHLIFRRSSRSQWRCRWKWRRRKKKRNDFSTVWWRRSQSHVHFLSLFSLSDAHVQSPGFVCVHVRTNSCVCVYIWCVCCPTGGRWCCGRKRSNLSKRLDQLWISMLVREKSTGWRLRYTAWRWTPEHHQTPPSWPWRSTIIYCTIHSQVRLNQLKKQQEQLVRESEATVARRETLVLRREVMDHSSHKQTSKGDLSRHTLGLQRKIKDTHKVRDLDLSLPVCLRVIQIVWGFCICSERGRVWTGNQGAPGEPAGSESKAGRSEAAADGSV